MRKLVTGLLWLGFGLSFVLLALPVMLGGFLLVWLGHRLGAGGGWLVGRTATYGTWGATALILRDAWDRAFYGTGRGKPVGIFHDKELPDRESDIPSASRR